METSVALLDTDVAARAFAALGSQPRLTVLRTLVRAGPDGLSMGVLAERCGIGGSTLTHHIRLLAEAGLVTQAREGRSIIIAAVAYDYVEDLASFLLRECCADSKCAVPHPHKEALDG